MISLEKRTADAESSIVNLLKREQSRGIDLGELTAQVEIAIDFSGSMGRRYRRNGDDPSEVQTVVERALALSLSGLDDDGVVPVHFFHSTDFPAELVDKSNYAGFVDDWADRHRMGGTAYGPTMGNILGGVAKNKIFGKPKVLATPEQLEAEKDQPPRFILFVTDGAPADQGAVTKLLTEAAARPFFWQFIGLGYSPKFLKKLDTMGHRVIDNVGLTEYQDTLAMTDEQFFDDIIGEFFTQWLPKARRLGITRR